MKIAGVIKNSFVDYPGKIATVVFAPGCNMRCWYCHNEGIKEDPNWTEEKLFDFLNERRYFLDGVVFSGGEVTLQPDLKQQMKKVKDLGLLVKLDTNGLNPKILREIIDEKLVDYVAMDIKAPFYKYDYITRVNCDINAIRNSIDILMSGKVPYEFRTTFAPDLKIEDIVDIAKNIIPGAENYSVQQYRTECYDRILMEKPHSDDMLKTAVELCKPFVKNVIAKGIN